MINGRNHWLLRQPDQVNTIDPWPGGHEVIASPVIRQTKMEEPQTAVSPLLQAHQCGILMIDGMWLFHLCLSDD